MQEYGKADYMWHIIKRYLADKRNLSMMTDTQRDLLLEWCRDKVFGTYPSVQQLEVRR